MFRVFAGVITVACAMLIAACHSPSSSSVETGQTQGASDESVSGVQQKEVQPVTELTAGDFVDVLRAQATDWIVVQLFQESCAPCLTEALRLQDRVDTWRQRGIGVIGCGIDPTIDEARGFIENTGGRVASPVYHAPWLAEQFEITATPVLLLYDSQGKLAAKFDPEQTDGDLLEAVEQAVGRSSR